MKKAVILISPGIDSPVAGFIASKKFELIGLNFFSFALTDKHIDLMKRIAKQIGIKKIFFINHSILHQPYQLNANKRFQCVFCKRSMLRLASMLCDEVGSDFIVTGENISQVATQTLSNMFAISRVVNKTILRPVLTYDKNEIISIARRIGTYDLNLESKEKCPFLPSNPVTQISVYRIVNEELKIDYDALLEQSFLKKKLVIVD